MFRGVIQKITLTQFFPETRCNIRPKLAYRPTLYIQCLKEILFVYLIRRQCLQSTVCSQNHLYTF